MNKYGARKKRTIKMKSAGKRILLGCLVIALSFSMMSWHKFSSIFAAVAMYGWTDDGTWAYKVLSIGEKKVSIRPSDLGAVKSSDGEIPSKVRIQGEDYTVTEIAPSAYCMCVCSECLQKNRASLSTIWDGENDNYISEDIETTIKKLTIPSTVVEIGISAFEDASLSQISFEKNSQLTTIRESAFWGCTLKNITIPKSVKQIDYGAFCSSSLQTAEFGEGSKITEIGESLFEDSRLKSIIIPETVTTIAENAFWNCKLTEISIPASVTHIEGHAFEHNTKLNTVDFLESGKLKKIGTGAFMECALAEITIPASVTLLDVCAFGNNSSLKTVALEATSKIKEMDDRAFANIPKYKYDEDDIEEMKEDCEKNTAVKQVHVKNYDMYQWIREGGIFAGDTKVYSEKTRVFLDKYKNDCVVDNVSMKSNQQATIDFENYVSAKKGYHFQGSIFNYSDILNENQTKTGEINGTKFVSYGYPYVVIKSNQQANEYKIVYNTNQGDTTVAPTKCRYDETVTISSTIPVRKGYIFTGWSKTATGDGNLYQPSAKVNENFAYRDGATVTLYARWKPITKRVTVHFSTPKKKSAKSGYEIVITRNGKTIQRHDIPSAEVGDKKLVITGARIGETYVISCTNYEKNKGKKKYYKATKKEVTIEE